MTPCDTSLHLIQTTPTDLDSLRKDHLNLERNFTTISRANGAQSYTAALRKIIKRRVIIRCLIHYQRHLKAKGAKLESTQDLISCLKASHHQRYATRASPALILYRVFQKVIIFRFPAFAGGTTELPQQQHGEVFCTFSTSFDRVIGTKSAFLTPCRAGGGAPVLFPFCKKAHMSFAGGASLRAFSSDGVEEPSFDRSF